MDIHLRYKNLNPVCGRRADISVGEDRLDEVTCNPCINHLESIRPGSVKKQITMKFRKKAETYAKETFKEPSESDILLVMNSMLIGYNAALGNEFLELQKR